MTKKHEELVGEIAEELGGICDPMASYHPSKEEYLRDVARTFITLTLSAFRDRRLDEELGVVGRVDTNERGIIEWFEELRDELHFTHGSYPILVAFSPESQKGEGK